MNKAGKRGLRIAVFWLLIILVVVVDQATKAAAIEILEHGTVNLIPHFIDFVLVRNSGAAFSFGQGGGILFILVAIFFLVAAAVYVINVDDLPFGLTVTIALVAGGGVGNMVDRIIMGSVTDFIAVRFIDFPVFNFADICVTVGVILSVFGFMRWESIRESHAEAIREDARA